MLKAKFKNLGLKTEFFDDGNYIAEYSADSQTFYFEGGKEYSCYFRSDIENTVLPKGTAKIAIIMDYHYEEVSLGQPADYSVYSSTGEVTNYKSHNEEIVAHSETGVGCKTEWIIVCREKLYSVKLLKQSTLSRHIEVYEGNHRIATIKEGMFSAKAAFEIDLPVVDRMFITHLAHPWWEDEDGAAYDAELKGQQATKTGQKEGNKPSAAGPMYDAVQEGEIETVKLLIEGGADVNKKGMLGHPPLNHAAACGHINVAEYLISKGADINGEDQNGQTPLHAAAFWAQKEICVLLISNDANTNAKDKFGFTPLHAAAGSVDSSDYAVAGSVDSSDFAMAMMVAAITESEDEAKHLEEISELFISNGADVNAQDNDGNTPLHWASTQGREGVAKTLISNGGNINAVSKINATPLDNASFNGHIEVVKILVAKGANVNAKDALGNTALHNAAAGGNKNIAELLISKGADINARSKGSFFRKGKTPLGLAVDADHKEVVELLKEHGAQE